MTENQVSQPLLLSQREAARKIGISKDTFRKMIPKLRALGMRVVSLPAAGKKRHIKFHTNSIEQAIDRAAEREVDLNA